jgi:hypothetical protein
MGAAITIVWNVLPILGNDSPFVERHLSDIVWPWLGTSVDAVYPALAASVLSLILVSLLTPPPAREKWEQFFT